MEIIDLNSISVALAAMQLNSTTVLSPALTSLNQFFAQVVAAIPRVISAAIILLIGYIIGRAVGWVISAFGKEKKWLGTNFNSRHRRKFYLVICQT